MSVFVIDPVHDPRWAGFLERHPRASVFHCPGWLEALRRTYGYAPFVLTTSPPGTALENGLPVCRVRTWLSGRLVSLPFSDHCDPLVERPEELADILSFFEDEVRHGGSRYVEFRPRTLALDPYAGPRFTQVRRYCLHSLDLTRPATELFRRFHASCVQRAIRRAEREGLTYERGASESVVASFYRLLRMTRRRHMMLPQPLAWFRNLVECLGETLTIHLASRDGEPVASILTLSFKNTVVYKYGCSDARYHSLGGMPFLFWRAIQSAREDGFHEFDLGRSDLDQPGLIAFKDRFGAARTSVAYYRHRASVRAPARDTWGQRIARRALARAPDPALTLAGKVLYKHFG